MGCALDDKDDEVDTIGEVLDCVEDAGEGSERVAVSEIVDGIGDGAFAPLLLVPALMVVSPASAIPGFSSVGGIVIALIAAQMAAGRKQLWLPGFIRRRTMDRKRLEKAVNFLSKPGRMIDRLTRRRLSFLVEPPLTRFWALVSMLMALFIPVFEMVPMSATIVASAVALFALAMLAKDGLLALLGLATLCGALYLIWTVAG